MKYKMEAKLTVELTQEKHNMIYAITEIVYEKAWRTNIKKEHHYFINILNMLNTLSCNDAISVADWEWVKAHHNRWVI